MCVAVHNVHSMSSVGIQDCGETVRKRAFSDFATGASLSRCQGVLRIVRMSLQVLKIDLASLLTLRLADPCMMSDCKNGK